MVQFHSPQFQINSMNLNEKPLFTVHDNDTVIGTEKLRVTGLFASLKLQKLLF